jgi:hypothetical protein
MKRLATNILAATFLIAGMAGVASAKDDGGASTAGGGPVVYQAIAIAKILAKNELLFQFARERASTIKTIEFLSAKDGISQYRVTSNGGCTVDITTTATDDSGMDYTVDVGSMICL